MADKKEKLLRKIPSIDALLKDTKLQKYTEGIADKIVVNSIRIAVDQVRKSIVEQKEDTINEDNIRQTIIDKTKKQIDSVNRPHYRRVINAMGIVLHTGLGRAVLPKVALNQITEQLAGYSLLQVDTETGKRSKRDKRIEELLQQLTGAEAATIVNNNAAATAIVLNTTAKGKEVIVSRGQLVEIGGSFRLPDVMAFSGAQLVEVGTTNKTHPADYKNAINENTAAILRVHPSNYKIQGFSSEVPLNELVEIAHSNNLVMIDDVGAGSLIDFSRFGFAPEPTLPESVKAGADIITSSGDKLIGGSQAGIIIGKTEWINAIRKNQFARIIRPGKLTLAALEASLKLFLDEQKALNEVPTLQMILRKQADISEQAEKIAAQLTKKISEAEIRTIEGFSQVGSGSLPTQNIATTLVAIKPKTISAEILAAKLRNRNIPIFTRIANEQVLIDPRTLRDDDGEILINSLIETLSTKK